MLITIGQTNDDRRKINKSFSGTDITVQLKQPCDMLSPMFVLTWDTRYVNANYLHCPDLGRYYFIDDVILLTGNRAELQCSVDVLMSYREQIMSLNVDVIRSESIRNKLVVDSTYPAEIMSTLTTLKFNATPFAANLASDLNIILSVIGGQYYSEE